MSKLTFKRVAEFEEYTAEILEISHRIADSVADKKGLPGDMQQLIADSLNEAISRAVEDVLIGY